VERLRTAREVFRESRACVTSTAAAAARCSAEISAVIISAGEIPPPAAIFDRCYRPVSQSVGQSAVWGGAGGAGCFHDRAAGDDDKTSRHYRADLQLLALHKLPRSVTNAAFSENTTVERLHTVVITIGQSNLT